MAEINQTPPAISKLQFMVANGEEMIPVVQDMLDRWKLPYIIDKIGEGKWSLKKAYTPGELWLNRFITIDPLTNDMKSDALKMSITPYEVLICGETGTGKEIIANSQIDDRKGATKVLNCAGIPRELFESELFGHVRGSFTGADRDKEGLLSSATQGLMFLDEVSEIPLDLQSKLLRAIQYKVIRKVGSNKEEKIDCKFVCATNVDLKKRVELGLFRKDLYARLSTLEIDIKPLRDRLCDVVPITESFDGGKELLSKCDYMREGKVDLSLNVRSIQQHVIRYNVLGKLPICI